MRVVVCGGRGYLDRAKVYAVLDSLEVTELAYGDALGADSLACEWGVAHAVPKQMFEARWKDLGRRAGPERNARMLAEFKPDLVVAFPGGRGTNDSVRRARKAGIRVLEVPA